jgi:hypothetical protein
VHRQAPACEQQAADDGYIGEVEDRPPTEVDKIDDVLPAKNIQ